MKMHGPAILIPLADLDSFEPGVQQALQGYLQRNFVSAITPRPLSTNESGLVEFGVAEAKTFLNNCSEKTTAILQQIIDSDGSFMMSEIARAHGATRGELRGAWAGLTKRTRTITQIRDAKLINWFRQGKDWRGVMAAKTVAAMRSALAER